MGYVISVLEQLIDDHKIGLERVNIPGYQAYSIDDYKDMIFELEYAIRILKTKDK